MTTHPELDRVFRAAGRLERAEVALLRAYEANPTTPVLDALHGVRRELADRKAEACMLLEAAFISEFEETGIEP